MKKLLMTVAIAAMTITACSPQEKVVSATPETTVTESVLKVQSPPVNKAGVELTSAKAIPAKVSPKPVEKKPSKPANKKSTVQQNIEKHLLKYKVSKNNAKDWAYYIVKYSKENGVDPYTVLAMMQVETGRTFDPNLVGKDDDVGLMQIRPVVQETVKVKGSRFDPELNIKMGCMYLAYTEKRFKTEDMGVVAYNQGEGNVSRGTYNTKYLKRVNQAKATIAR